MRLSTQQHKGIILAITLFLDGKNAELRLYGSRVNNNLKGGDIDLLLLVDDCDLITNLIKDKHYILASIKKHIGEQKIDLVIASSNMLEHDIFLTMIVPQSLILNRW